MPEAKYRFFEIFKIFKGRLAKGYPGQKNNTGIEFPIADLLTKQSIPSNLEFVFNEK